MSIFDKYNLDYLERYSKYIIIFLVLTTIVFATLFFTKNYELNQTIQDKSSSTTNQIVYSSSTYSNIREIKKNEDIGDFKKALPYIADNFMVSYDSTTNTMVVTSNYYDNSQLEKIVTFWLSEYPSVDIDSYKWVYKGKK